MNFIEFFIASIREFRATRAGNVFFVVLLSALLFIVFILTFGLLHDAGVIQ